MNWKIWVLIGCVIASLAVIFAPLLSFTQGVEIIAVTRDSPAFMEGIREGMIITGVNGKSITSFDDYTTKISPLFPTQEQVKIEITTIDETFVLFLNESPQITVRTIPKTRLQTGLDLSGGARALIAAEKELSPSELQDLISVTNERLNVYGLKDVQVRPVTDLSGRNLMLVEIAGSTPEELNNLITQQGKFEAKIGNDTIFTGGNKDITYVARSGDQAGIYSCHQQEGSHVCQFQFAISLSEDAAQRHADRTNELNTDPTNPGYLDKQLDLYLDDKLIDSLFISTSLKGSKTTQISISGSETGATRDEAITNAENEMKQLQTVLITGSLPFKLEIEKLDTISPLLGAEFITTILLAGLASILAVSVIVFIRYRKITLSLAVLLTSLSEVAIILGVSALFNRSLDLPAIAGIVAAIGTGVDSQIIILDESQMHESSMRERIKRALYIIVGTYVTTLFALLPLMWAGAGLLKGFAITTILGISIGVFITRPAFSEMVRNIVKE